MFTQLWRIMAGKKNIPLGEQEWKQTQTETIKDEGEKQTRNFRDGRKHTNNLKTFKMETNTKLWKIRAVYKPTGHSPLNVDDSTL